MLIWCFELLPSLVPYSKSLSHLYSVIACCFVHNYLVKFNRQVADWCISDVDFENALSIAIKASCTW